MQLIWSDNSIDDMDNIYHYYSQESVRAADRIINTIYSDAQKLIDNPRLGAIEKYLTKLTLPYRSLVVKGGIFKIIYMVYSNKILIYRIWDCRQNPKSLL